MLRFISQFEYLGERIIYYQWSFIVRIENSLGNFPSCLSLMTEVGTLDVTDPRTGKSGHDILFQ